VNPSSFRIKGFCHSSWKKTFSSQNIALQGAPMARTRTHDIYKSWKKKLFRIKPLL